MQVDQACDFEAGGLGKVADFGLGGRGNLSALSWLKNTEQHLGFLVPHLSS